ncbi:MULTISPECIES: MTH1187 family thiamine-binding protein [unclassified Flammeovirga]|uniref:MTH1187 family thiamine-binding protein n=1 Tax=unclassified Flammeovirga TaxID=2637820 RepID=UPI0005C7529E|nr:MULTISPECIES: MTH1187 family thiamine-binding protein [unclassified Flammeovirga]MBD0400709.1 MTH1187 family thiamine-binding protein [Flammeovirga sp. EKP202]
MGAIMNFAIFPIDKGDHIGEYVSKVVQHIKESGLTYQFSPMGTVIEAETVTELLKVVDEAYKIMDPISDRIYCVMNMDYNKNKSNMIKSKTESIEKRIGKVD